MTETIVGVALLVAFIGLPAAMKIHMVVAARRNAREWARSDAMAAGLTRIDEIRAVEGDEAADTFAARLRERFKDRP